MKEKDAERHENGSQRSDRVKTKEEGNESRSSSFQK